MTDTPHLGLPFIEGSQAQKHVTHNEALRILDAVVQIGVLDANRTAPPSSPADGDRHIVASGAAGAWAGQARAIALHEDGGWRFLAPKAGWCAWSAADGALLVFDGTAWGEVASGGGGGGSGTGDSVAKLGVNDTATAPNLLTVRSNDALFHAVVADDGGSGDMRLQIAKEGAANTASVFFSDAYSGHAEFGLTGDNNFHLKVSADGTIWRDAVTFDHATGRASFPGGGVRELLAASRTYYVRTDGSDGNNGLSNTSGGAFATIQKAVDVVAALDLSIYNVTIQVGAGTYTAAIRVNGPWIGSGTVTLSGDVATPANVVVSTTSADCIAVTGRGNLSIQGFKLQTATSGNALVASGGGTIRVTGNIVFGAVAGIAVYAFVGGSIIDLGANYTIAGSSSYHLVADLGAQVTCYGRTVTLTGTPAFSSFAYCASLSMIGAVGNTYSGAATGQRYNVSANAVLNTGGGGASMFPGNAAGVVGTGGQYL